MPCKHEMTIMIYIKKKEKRIALPYNQIYFMLRVTGHKDSKSFVTAV